MASLSADDAKRIEEVYKFWYGPALDKGFSAETMSELQRLWYSVDPATNQPLSKEARDAQDADIKARFAGDIDKLAAGEYDHWAATGKGVSAICVLGDQMTRNVYRGTGKAFSLDPKVLQIVLTALDKGLDKEVPYMVSVQWRLPLMHAESMEIQDKLVAWTEEQVKTLPEGFERTALADMDAFAKTHRDIIARFGRYPYRNKALGRESTPEEEAYLAEGANSFGQ